jgi:hypothetical protein
MKSRVHNDVIKFRIRSQLVPVPYSKTVLGLGGVWMF